MSFGKALSDFGSGLLTGPLGVVQIGYKGYDLGMTVDAATLKPDLNIKDILYQQKGTKAADHVITGADWMLSGSFGEINTQLLKIIAPYLVGSNGTSGSDSGTFKASLYESLLETVADVVKVAQVVDQVPSESVEDTMYFYKGIFLINADLINWGADVQRNLPFEIRLKGRKLTDAESTKYANKVVFGYYGDPVVEDVPAAEWPDLDAPYVVSSAVASATSVTLTLSENATEIAGAISTEQMVVKVDSKYVIPTVVAYATNVITLTLPAASIAAGQVVETSIGAGTFEDGDSNANEAVADFPAVNSL
jgi:hypothetical protein